jgi:hypothetical protein
MAMIGDDWQRRYRRFNQTTGTLQLTTKQWEEPADAEAGAEVDEIAEIDSIDSPICACGSSMLMTFSHAHDVLLCEQEGIARVY